MVSSVTLKDRLTGDTIAARVKTTDLGIEMSFVGFGDCGSANGCGSPVFIEVRGGQLTIHVWSDINQEDPTHVISLEHARQDHYRPRV